MQSDNYMSTLFSNILPMGLITSLVSLLYQRSNITRKPTGFCYTVVCSTST